MAISRHFGALAVLGFLLLASHAPRAQSSAQNPLPTAKSLKCVFPLYATGTWKNLEPQAEVKTANLAMRFDSIDAQDGTAEVTGMSARSAGAPHITVQLSGGNIHFLAVDNSGALYITTVFFDRESRGGKLKAVHTRHEFTEVSLPGYTSRPEQYYGECQAEQ